MELDQEDTQGGLRADGRRASELRQIRMRMGVFGQADGSAYIEHGNTKVLATVYGPHQPRSSTSRNITKAVVNCQYSMAVFSFSSGERKRRPRGDWKSQERSAQLRHAMEAIIHLELYPRSQIDVFVEVLQVDGSDYCASVNAATLALIDSGIPIKAGCTVTLINTSSTEDEDKTLAMGVLDANFVEECSPGVTLSVVALLETNNDVEVDANGLIVIAHGAGQRLHLSRLETLKRRALQGCQDIKDILNRSVKDHLTANLLPSFLHSSLK
ncbi:hypothetical protein HN011_007885 [Eciton burchellii]|nr:hypothetical protein HN011_007885 [Eciton burchellii]